MLPLGGNADRLFTGTGTAQGLPMVSLRADTTKSLETTSTAPSAACMPKWHEVENSL